jgi:hypothetical protein
MDLLDHIAALLRALFGDPGSTGRPPGSGMGAGRTSGGYSARPADPDLAAALDELNDYLGADQEETGGRSHRGGAQSSGHGPQSSPMPPESLRGDYANLEVPFGADIGIVRRSYKQLVLRYHPDRHADNPEKLRVATEITKKINESFERIRTFQDRTGAGDR